VKIKAANRDLHPASRRWRANPIRVLTRILGWHFDENGRYHHPGLL